MDTATTNAVRATPAGHSRSMVRLATLRILARLSVGESACPWPSGHGAPNEAPQGGT